MQVQIIGQLIYYNDDNNKKEGVNMGKYNSSVFRVRPLMNAIENDSGKFQDFLKNTPIISHIDSKGNPLCEKKLGEIIGRALGKPEKCYYDGDKKDCKEKRLKPPKKHLEKLIRHLAEKDFETRSETIDERCRLFYGDDKEGNRPPEEVRKEACKQAIAQLEASYDNMAENMRYWFIFEGYSAPDILIEGKDYIILCEGKWTESGITDKTRHLSDADEHRCQMLRHIQGALNCYNKTIYAFYIVDAECEYKHKLTVDAFRKQVKDETIEIESDEEIKEITDCFLGYTTWRKIEELFPEIGFKGIDQIDSEMKKRD